MATTFKVMTSVRIPDKSCHLSGKERKEQSSFRLPWKVLRLGSCSGSQGIIPPHTGHHKINEAPQSRNDQCDIGTNSLNEI